MTHDGEALLKSGGGLNLATLKRCKSSLGARPCESQVGDMTSAGIQMCHIHLLLAVPQRSSPSRPLQHFNELSR